MSAEFGSIRTTRARQSLRRLIESDDTSLLILANELDLPADDGETLDFLRQAFNRTINTIELRLAEDKVRRLSEASHEPE